MDKNPETEGHENLDAELETVRTALIDMSQTLDLIRLEILEGGPDRIRESVRVLSDIRSWAKLAIETEARFEERQQRQQGAVNGYALDLEEARHTIGCRLARLRRCCGAGQISE
ncbi:hypothetical protein N6L24_04565 [Cognatishimia sp. SS12]|uniref:hypothetical protein n=1 Tax=Cognatishimia sp. SS12 TaxID=2979465 RepID=UPI00232D80A1|nr:hypothetical protein [Cognatishimia sp. SS12]MDC0737539.1 hypothetical protein [Cognatishimia sp. SS12]